MKKSIGLILALGMTAAALTACGSKNDAPKTTEPAATTAAAVAETQAAAPETQAQAAADTYTFVYKGTNIPMHADAAPILSSIGDYKSYTEEDSCAFPGEKDRNYTYSSFILTTYPKDGGECVNSVSLLDDTVATTDGVCIGDSKDKVESVYGSDGFNGVNAYIMTEGNSQLTIIITDDKVSSIQYAALFE